MNRADIQVGKFLLPRPGYPVDYKSEKEMYWHIGEKDVSSHCCCSEAS